MSGNRFSPTKEIPQVERSDLNRNREIVLLLMICFFEGGTEVVSWPKLEFIWPKCMKKFRGYGLTIRGFYRDVSRDSNPDLYDAYVWLSNSGFAHYLSRDNGRLHLDLTHRMIRKFKSSADPKELEVMSIVGPKILRRYIGTYYRPSSY